MISNFQVQQGWQCPVCKRVYSPFTPCCFYCGEEGMTKTTTTITTSDTEVQNCNTCTHNSGYPSTGRCKGCDSDFSNYEKENK